MLERAKLKDLQEFGKTICQNVCLFEHGEMKRLKEVKGFDEKLQIVAYYNYEQNHVYII